MPHGQLFVDLARRLGDSYLVPPGHQVRLPIPGQQHVGSHMWERRQHGHSRAPVLPLQLSEVGQKLNTLNDFETDTFCGVLLCDWI